MNITRQNLFQVLLESFSKIKDREDVTGDAGADTEHSERDGRDICRLYRYFLFFREFNKNNTKFQGKRGGRGPLGQPLSPPKGVDGCCSSLLFSILARASFKMDTTSVTFFTMLFWPGGASCNEGGKSWLIAVLYVAQLTKRRTEEVTTWKWRNDETSPLRRLEEKVVTKEKFHDTKKGQRCPKKTVRWNERGERRLEDMKPTPLRQQTITWRTIFEAKKCLRGHEKWVSILSTIWRHTTC